MAAAAERTFNVVLIGMTGCGKSASGNLLLGRREFQEDPGQNPRTLVCSDRTVRVLDLNLKVIDTPGFMAVTNRDNDTEVIRCMEMALTGVDAFLYVFKYGERFTEAHLQALQTVGSLFGDSIDRHLIVVFTKKAECLQRYGSVRNYIATGLSAETMQLLRRVSNRYVFVENNVLEAEIADSRLAIIDRIRELIWQPNYQPYMTMKFVQVNRAIFVAALVRLAVFNLPVFTMIASFVHRRPTADELNQAHEALLHESIRVREVGVARTWLFIIAASTALTAGAGFVTTALMPHVYSILASQAGSAAALDPQTLSAAVAGLAILLDAVQTRSYN